MLTPAPARARAAADSVDTLFARRLLGLPGTLLPATSHPRSPRAPWHYWWQAHYLDCLVDAALRGSTTRDTGISEDAARHLRSARRLLRGIWLRNGCRWTNDYYDDMAWLALAAGRFGRTVPPLENALVSAHTGHLGGGLFWNTARDFKNTPATAPAALYFARAGDTARAQKLLDWLHARLRDADSGLYQDGIRLRGDREQHDRTIYTYNQGPVLGALVTVGGSENLSRAARLVEAAAARLTDPGGALITHGSGDGGLFTGILVRYLALAALDPSLPAHSRWTASAMVTTTADAVWAGRAERTAASRSARRRRPVLVFPVSPDSAADAERVELSTQLQAWMIFESAHRIEGRTE